MSNASEDVRLPVFYRDSVLICVLDVFFLSQVCYMSSRIRALVPLASYQNLLEAE